MIVREQGYVGWEGELRRGGAWRPILRAGIRAIWKKRFAKLVLAANLLPFIFYLGALYVSTKPELKMFTHLVRLLSSDTAFFHSFFVNGFSFFWLLVLCIFAGADLIAGDLRHRSLALYFSRPLSRGQYLIGKFAVIAFFPLLFTLGAGLLLVVFKGLFTGNWPVSLPLLGGVVAMPLLVTFFYSAMTLFFSSLSTNLRLVSIMIFFLFPLTQTVGQAAKALTGNPRFLLLSLQDDLHQVGSLLFAQRPHADFPPVYSLLVMIGVGMLFGIVVWWRIGRFQEAT
jgi:ABC-type transport system involved in multi-copper enzyme maturation permease subunit